MEKEHFHTRDDRYSFGNYTLSKWVEESSVAGHLQQYDASSFLNEDRQKIERLLDLNKRIGLPIHHYLILESGQFTSNVAKVREFFVSQSESLLAIRAIPLQQGFAPSRVLGVTREECVEYLRYLSDQERSYRIYVWDHFAPEFSGTVIITDDNLYAEMTQGDHTLLTQQALGSTSIITGRLLFPNYRMVYSTDDIGIRKILWQAIKYLIVKTCGEISPLSLPIFLRGYFEFTFHSVKGYRFFDFNDHPLIAQTPYPEFIPAILPCNCTQVD